MLDQYLPIILMLIAGISVAAGIIILSAIFGPKSKNQAKDEPYECGIRTEGLKPGRYSVRFFIVALLFLLFDVEVAFLFPWAVIVKKLALLGLIEVGFFIVILFIGLLYVWFKGGLQLE